METALFTGCLAELYAALAQIEPELTGLRDQRLLPEIPETAVALDLQIETFTRRQDLLAQAIAALMALEADGYPVVAVADIPNTVWEELQRHLAEIQAALLHFHPVATLLVPIDAQVVVLPD